MSLNKTTAPDKDPVCGMSVDAAKAKAQTTYRGRNIYFCSQACLQTYLSHPKKYRFAKKKGVWTRFVERLDKAMKANPPSCHG